jgi:hypothetical protein
MHNYFVKETTVSNIDCAISNEQRGSLTKGQIYHRLSQQCLKGTVSRDFRLLVFS